MLWHAVGIGSTDGFKCEGRVQNEKSSLLCKKTETLPAIMRMNRPKYSLTNSNRSYTSMTSTLSFVSTCRPKDARHKHITYSNQRRLASLGPPNQWFQGPTWEQLETTKDSPSAAAHVHINTRMTCAFFGICHFWQNRGYIVQTNLCGYV